MKLEVLCIGQMYGRCKCEVDTDPNHHPNNYDCPDYIPITIRHFKAIRKDLYSSVTSCNYGKNTSDKDKNSDDKTLQKILYEIQK